MNQQVLNVRLVNNAVLGTTEDSVGAHTVIGLLKQLYEKLRTSTGNTSINIGVIQGAIRALENTVNGSTETTPPIEGLTTKVAGINTQINGITSDISGINSSISTINSDITALKSRATSIEEVNQQQTVKINDNEDDISALTTRVNAIDNSNDGRLTVVEHSVANLVSEVEGQGGALDDIIDLQADVSNLQTDVGTLQQTVNNLPPGGVGQSTNQTGGERFNLYESRNTASGDYSHAEGYLTQATGNYSHVEGSSNVASGESSHAEGSSCTAYGVRSHAEGFGARATESYSHAEGYYTVAGGAHSHAEGYRSQATTTAAHAEGGAYDNSSSYGARGAYSHVEGYSCLASASQAHAEGDHCKATGTSSHAEGFTCTAGAMYAHAAGEFTYADSRALTVVGINNTRTTGIANRYARLFVVGNGSGSGSSTRSDAFVVNYDGSVIINSTQSETTPSLTIGPNSKAITGTTATSSSTETDDSIIATKYYVDDKTNSINHFVYYGPVNIGIVTEVVNVSLVNRSITEFGIVYYDYNNGNHKATIIIPRLITDLATGHNNVSSSSTFAFGISDIELHYLGRTYQFRVNKPDSYTIHPCHGICEGICYSYVPYAGSAYSGVLSVVPLTATESSSYTGDLLVYAFAPIRGASAAVVYSELDRYICFKITYIPNKVTVTIDQ